MQFVSTGGKNRSRRSGPETPYKKLADDACKTEVRRFKAKRRKLIGF